jgi:hypothetical protein
MNNSGLYRYNSRNSRNSRNSSINFNRGINAENYASLISEREGSLRNKAYWNMLNGSIGNNNNNNNSNNGGINAELYPNNVSQREANLRTEAMERIEPGKNNMNFIKPSLKPYMFNRSRSNIRAYENRAAAVNRIIAAENARKKAIVNARVAENHAKALALFVKPEGAGQFPGGLKRENAEHPNLPGRHRFRKSKKLRKQRKNKTRRH